MRFPKTIRLDQSDAHAFERAAEPGEWAVTGAFAFADIPPDALEGKTRQAFRNGFLGLESFGWSTFVSVAEIAPAEYDEVVERLADHFVAAFGAPDRGAALAAAREEADFAASLCEQPVNTVITVSRDHGPEGIVEEFRTVETGGAETANVWQVADED